MAFAPSPPIRILRTQGGLKVVDGAGRPLAYIYTRESEADARHAGVLTEAEGTEVAQLIARAMKYAAGTGS